MFITDNSFYFLFLIFFFSIDKDFFLLLLKFIGDNVFTIIDLFFFKNEFLGHTLFELIYIG